MKWRTAGRMLATISIALASTAAPAQEILLRPRVFNDVPQSVLTTSVDGSTVTFSDQKVSAPTGYANRHDWRLSTNGVTERLFGPGDTFDLSATVTLTAAPDAPRKEAGLRIGGACEGLFLVNSDAREVVAFGGPLPFYKFGFPYEPGTAVTLRLRYLQQGGKNGFIYSANGIESPFLEANLCSGAWLGGYLQVQNAPATASNGGTAVFANIALSTGGTNPPPVLTDEQLLDRTQAQSCRYASDFLVKTAPATGFPLGRMMVADNSRYPTYSSVAATGFGLVCLAIEAARYGTTPEWTVTPEIARATANAILDTVLEMQAGGPDRQYAGLPYHFVAPGPDGAFRRNGVNEVSTVDGAYLVSGALAAGRYFGGEVQDKAELIAAAVQWRKFIRLTAEGPRFSHGWRPEEGDGFTVPQDGGYLAAQTWDRVTDELIAIVILALGNEPHNRDFLGALYSWPRVTRSYRGGNGVTYSLVPSYFGSMFTYTQLHPLVPFDLLGPDHPSDVGSGVQPIDWWKNAVTAARASRQFSIDHAPGATPPDSYPIHAAFGPDSWGLTAAASPENLDVYEGLLGAPPREANGGAPEPEGIIAPYGAITAMRLMRTSPDEPLAQNAGFRALRHYYDTRFESLWGPYGPKDAFDDLGRVANVYIGIDTPLQGIAIEDYRSGRPAAWFTSSPRIADALAVIFHRGLSPGDVDYDGAVTAQDAALALRLAAGLLPARPAQAANGDVVATPGQTLAIDDALAILRMSQ